jgi:HPt (histidine-containing phosphotransfer) domain-containing protein
MSDPVAAALRELRREYRAEGPARVTELAAAFRALSRGEESAEVTLAMLCHRLAGSGGAYGFPDVSIAARAMEQLLRSEPHWTPERLAEVEDGIRRIAEAFAREGPD